MTKSNEAETPPAGGDPVAAARNIDTAEQGQQAVEKALSQPMAPPVVTTHSTALAGEFLAKAESLKAMAADIDAKMALLAAEREDIMLAYSMLSHGMTARDKGRTN